MLVFASFLTIFGQGQVRDTMAHQSREIIFASDTQAPMWVETLLLKTNNNRAATKDIFGDILTH